MFTNPFTTVFVWLCWASWLILLLQHKLSWCVIAMMCYVWEKMFRFDENDLMSFVLVAGYTWELQMFCQVNCLDFRACFAGAAISGASHFTGTAKALEEEGITRAQRLRALPTAVSLLIYNLKYTTFQMQINNRDAAKSYGDVENQQNKDFYLLLIMATHVHRVQMLILSLAMTTSVRSSRTSCVNSALWGLRDNPLHSTKHHDSYLQGKALAVASGMTVLVGGAVYALITQTGVMQIKNSAEVSSLHGAIALAENQRVSFSCFHLAFVGFHAFSICWDNGKVLNKALTIVWTKSSACWRSCQFWRIVKHCLKNR